MILLRVQFRDIKTNMLRRRCIGYIVGFLLVLVWLPPVESAGNCPEGCNCRGIDKIVECRNKALTSVPKNLSGLITSLDLSNNDITSIKADDFQNMEFLRTLFLEGNGITEIDPTAFRNMYKLSTINLRKNELTSLPARLFQHLPSLMELNLMENNITRISRYAFFTIPRSKKLSIKMGGNRVVCDCEMFALKKWLYPEKSSEQHSMSALDPEDLKCANAAGGGRQGLPLSDMSDDDFACEDHDQSIFTEDQTCRTCESDWSKPLETCGKVKQHMTPCNTDEEKQPVCYTHMTYRKGLVKVSQGCSTYSDCMRQERENKEKCSIFKASTTLECHLCCVGSLCNDTTFGDHWLRIINKLRQRYNTGRTLSKTSVSMSSSYISGIVSITSSYNTDNYQATSQLNASTSKYIPSMKVTETARSIPSTPVYVSTDEGSGFASSEIFASMSTLLTEGSGFVSSEIFASMSTLLTEGTPMETHSISSSMSTTKVEDITTTAMPTDPIALPLVSPVKGRFKEYSAYVTFVIRNGVFDKDLDDSTSQKYKDLVDKLNSAIKEGFPTILGKFTGSDITFSGPTLEVHFLLKGALFLQKGADVSRGVFHNAINESITQNKIKALDISSAIVRDSAIKFCQSTNQSTVRGTFWWFKIPEGSILEIGCPNKPQDNDGSTHKVLQVASRKCMSTNGEAVWMDPVVDQCPYDRRTTQQLEDLYSTPVTKHNVLNVSRQLQHLALEFPKFDHEDVNFAVGILEKIVASSDVSREVISNAVNVISSLIGVQNGVLLEAEKIKQTTTRMLKSVNKLTTTANLTDTPLLVVQPNIAIAAVKVDPKRFAGVSLTTGFNDDIDGALEANKMKILESGSVVEEDRASTISLPSSLFDNVKTDDVVNVDRITFSVYPSDKLFVILEKSRKGPSVNPTGKARPTDGSTAQTSVPPTGSSVPAGNNASAPVENGVIGRRIINSRIVSASIPKLVIKNLKNPVLIHLPHLRKQSKSDVNAKNPECVFWRQSSGQLSWSNEGCSVQDYVPDTYTTCACDHLTNFALLMDVYDGGVGISEADKVALSVISYVGCGISLVCLLLTLFTYMMFRKLRRDNPSKILVNLCIALALANVIFLVGLQDYTFQNTTWCKVVAVLLHYFLLSSLTWMAVEAFYMYLALVLVFKTYFTNFILKCCVIGWGVPLLIVAITLGVNSTENYGLLDSGICWIHNPAFYFAFLAPVAVILLLNFAAFALVLRQILGISSRKLNKSDKTSTATHLRGAMGVVILLGLTWVFAVFAIGGAHLAFNYLFAITNSLQGLFIFIFYCVLKKDALAAWRRKLPCCEVVDDRSGERSSSKGWFQGVVMIPKPPRANANSNAGYVKDESDVNDTSNVKSVNISSDATTGDTQVPNSA